MTVVMAIPAVAVVVVMTADVDDHLGVGGPGERSSENKGEQRIQKGFHIRCDSDLRAEVVIRAQHLHRAVTLTPPIKRLV
jgi:hypothetical protein